MLLGLLADVQFTTWLCESNGRLINWSYIPVMPCCATVGTYFIYSTHSRTSPRQRLYFFNAQIRVVLFYLLHLQILCRLLSLGAFEQIYESLDMLRNRLIRILFM
jgi:hypothetical protein